MKRTALSTFILFLFITGNAQITVNKRLSFLKKVELVNLDTIEADFIHMQVHNRVLSLKITCSVDYGQKRRLGKRKSKIRLENGRKRKFNSDAAFVNYVTAHGWDYVEYDNYAFVFRAKKK